MKWRKLQGYDVVTAGDVWCEHDMNKYLSGEKTPRWDATFEAYLITVSAHMYLGQRVDSMHHKAHWWRFDVPVARKLKSLQK